MMIKGSISASLDTGLQTGKKLVAALALASLALVSAPQSAMAQMTQIDPNAAIDADLGTPQAPAATTSETTAGADYSDPSWSQPADAASGIPTASADGTATTAPVDVSTVDPSTTYKEDDLIGAAEGVFGKGAEGLARMIQGILKEQGEPNGYIVGREAGGAFIVGLRYGSGTLFHKIEGQRDVYWTGPSVGFDAGANASNSFVLVYNLHDSEDLYKRYPSGEGTAYLVGGFTASYLRRGDVVLIPVRLGVGMRLGANVGYMKFSKTQRWLPL